MPFMIQYTMVRDGMGHPHVLVERDGRKAYSLPHLLHHSPGGFEWGYGGSGPFDLARSIVGDFLGTEDPPAPTYRLVVSELVSRLPFEGGTITDAELIRVISPGPHVRSSIH